MRIGWLRLSPDESLHLELRDPLGKVLDAEDIGIEASDGVTHFLTSDRRTYGRMPPLR